MSSLRLVGKADLARRGLLTVEIQRHLIHQYSSENIDQAIGASILCSKAKDTNSMCVMPDGVTSRRDSEKKQHEEGQSCAEDLCSSGSVSASTIILRARIDDEVRRVCYSSYCHGIEAFGSRIRQSRVQRNGRYHQTRLKDEANQYA